MAQELLYTSAPRGLKSGSRGFCTVEATAGLPPALVAALEGLSGYRHVAPPGDPANPVVQSHVTISIGGRTYSVLSRVADAGNDYTGRTNKLAHHLALEASERPSGGPAWLLARPGLLKTRFDGEPRTLPPRTVPAGDRPPAVCQAWKAAVGDAGWAGVLAEAYLADPSRPAYLVVPPGLDVRLLLEEAIALLPPDRRWGATFTTFYTSLPQAVTCSWRAVLAGSKEEHESKRFVQALRLNLTSPLGVASGGTLAEAARSGRVPFRPTAVPPTIGLGKPTEQMVDEEMSLDLVAVAGPTRPQRLIEPLMRPPELHRRSKVRATLWAGAAVICLLVIISPIVLVVRNWMGPGSVSKTGDSAPTPTRDINASAAPHPPAPPSNAEPPVANDQPKSEVTIAEVQPGSASQEAGTDQAASGEQADTSVAEMPEEDEREQDATATAAPDTELNAETDSVRTVDPPETAPNTDANAQAAIVINSAVVLQALAKTDGEVFNVTADGLTVSDDTEFLLHVTREAQDRGFSAVHAAQKITIIQSSNGESRSPIPQAEITRRLDTPNPTVVLRPAEKSFGNILREKLLWCPLIVRNAGVDQQLVWWTPVEQNRELQTLSDGVRLPLPREYDFGKGPDLRVGLSLQFSGLADDKPTTCHFSGTKSGSVVSDDYKTMLLDDISKTVEKHWPKEGQEALTKEEIAELMKPFHGYAYQLKTKQSQDGLGVIISPGSVLAPLMESINKDAGAIYEYASWVPERAIRTKFQFGAVVETNGVSFMAGISSKVENAVQNYRSIYSRNTARLRSCRMDIVKLRAVAAAADKLRNATVVAASVGYDVTDASGKPHQIVFWSHNAQE